MTYPTIHPAMLPDLGLSDPVAKSNILLNAFRVAINGGLSVFNMVDGVVDEFEDETGVTTKTGATYDVSGDYYHNPGSQAMIDRSSGTAIGDMTGAGGVAASFDGNTAQDDNNSSNSASATVCYIGKDWGSGVTNTVSGVKLFPCSSHGYCRAGGANTAYTMQATLQGSTDNFSSSVVDLGSWTFPEAAGYPSVSVATERLSEFTTTTAYRYHRIKLGTIGSDTESFALSEVQFYETVAPADMTLISDPFTAETEPTEGMVIIWEEDVDSITLDTDLKAWASIDNGNNWDQATLTEVATLDTGRILTGTADVSARTGTTMLWKITSHNNKELKVHGVGLEWS